MTDFSRYFALRVARTQTELERLQHLRWEVYCREFHYEREEDCPDEREVDVFDVSAIHVYAEHRLSGELAGTVRIVCADALRDGLPLEQAYSAHAQALDLGEIPRSHLIEISRLAVSAKFRRRSGEVLSPIGLNVLMDPDELSIMERSLPLLPLALYLSVAAIVDVRGVHEAFGYAMMQSRLVRLLKRFGIQFQQAGPEIEYHGKRAAYRITLDEVVGGLDAPMRSLYDTLVETIAADLPRASVYPGSICGPSVMERH
jgi:N-acyl amino acid synthase of PEP-CTERM/exosortase system